MFRPSNATDNDYNDDSGTQKLYGKPNKNNSFNSSNRQKEEQKSLSKRN